MTGNETQTKSINSGAGVDVPFDEIDCQRLEDSAKKCEVTKVDTVLIYENTWAFLQGFKINEE